MSAPVEPRSSVIALSGNPRSGSRTLLVARTLAETLAAGTGPGGPGDRVQTLELAEIAGEIFAAEAPRVQDYLRVLAGARVAVVATPVYKASYTGLLKAFLDRYGPGGLTGVLAVPVVVSASPAHGFVAEHLLQPLLVELGALVPVRPFAITEQALPELADRVQSWMAGAAPVITRLTATTPEPTGER